MIGIVLWRWMLISFFFFSKVDYSQYRNTFRCLLSSIRDTEYYRGITISAETNNKEEYKV